MGQILLIGIAAGAASALLVAGVAAGTMLAVPLYYLAPLPIMVAGLAFSHWAGLIGVAVAGLGLALAFGSTLLVAYLVATGGPAWVLAYAALLARAEPAGRGGLVWLPIPALVLLAAALATVGTIVGLLSVATDLETYRAAVKTAFDAFVQAEAGSSGLAPADAANMASLVASVLPPMAGVLSMVTQILCLYLAGRAAMLSGRLARPWPDLAGLRLPQAASLALAVIVAASVAPGMVGLSASVAGGTLLTGFALAGFAVIHFLSRGRSARPLILTAVWVATAALGWPVLVVAVLGLIDTMFDLRTRFGTAGGPPAANDR
ncbi:DUF2232 domain-containing protein [Aquabacter spiritensis]|uniref:Putative membrane protein DUF2232 n=1 Tax=Aquabacter spiritensis TaxID=933073 RepID=A0A4R3M1A2_9HYPH|nr:DUF2232 domain-containing protein [Aquabacter spiritensis]TCT06884.1 putative membrane protein DUF2232 [Aquabacter spiritensis]